MNLSSIIEFSFFEVSFAQTVHRSGFMELLHASVIC